MYGYSFRSITCHLWIASLLAELASKLASLFVDLNTLLFLSHSALQCPLQLHVHDQLCHLADDVI